MALEGRLVVELERRADGQASARVTTSRPLGFARAFEGGSPADAVRTLPLLLSICGIAQGTAAAEACERALGIAIPQSTRAARRLLVLAETAREHGIRTVVDWPRMMGDSPDGAAMLGIMRVWEGLRSAIDPRREALTLGAETIPDAGRIAPAVRSFAELVESQVLGEPISAFEARRMPADLISWQRSAATAAQRLLAFVTERGWADAGQAACRFLPELDDNALAARILGPSSQDYVARPTIDGLPHETGVLARVEANPLVRELSRVHGNGLLTRLAARLVEIAALPALMSKALEDLGPDEGRPRLVCSSAPAAGCGVAHVQAARGCLTHGVEVDGNVVRRYAILAPTEWNFHPEGGAREGLECIARRGGDLTAVAELFVNTLDPCIPYEVRVH